MVWRFFFCLILLAVCTSVYSNEKKVWNQYGGPNRDFISTEPLVNEKGEALVWRQPLGPGTSGIVTDGKRLFTMYSVVQPKEPNRGTEVVVALDIQTGKTLWDHSISIVRLKGQESFRGDPICPQSTPALKEKRLCTLGYTGLLKCFDIETGKVVWEIDLVKDYEATPVQFGFSASPLVYGDCFIVHVGGKQSALIAFQIVDGKPRWKSDPAPPSYASPVLMKVGEEDQIIQVTRDRIVGVLASTGEKRWSYPMPKEGLTNVPTPIPLLNQQLLVSGQGILGTRLLQLEGKGSNIQIKEIWKNEKTPFFYCNWVATPDGLFGNVGPFLYGFSLASGKELWRERSQPEANQIRLGKETILLCGDGKLTRGILNPEGFTELGSYSVLKGRTWSSPMYHEGILYLRDNKEIAAIRYSALVK